MCVLSLAFDFWTVKNITGRYTFFARAHTVCTFLYTAYTRKLPDSWWVFGGGARSKKTARTSGCSSRNRCAGVHGLAWWRPASTARLSCAGTRHGPSERFPRLLGRSLLHSPGTCSESHIRTHTIQRAPHSHKHTTDPLPKRRRYAYQ